MQDIENNDLIRYHIIKKKKKATGSSSSKNLRFC